MRLSRREALAAGAAAGAGVLAAGCGRLVPLAREGGLSKAEPVERFDAESAALRRLTIEPTEKDRERYRELGHRRFVEGLLAADEDEGLPLTLRLRRYDAIHLDAATLMDLPEARVREGLQSATVLRACYGANPLKERMAIFWGEHFNVFARKGDGTFYRGGEEAAIRTNALGSFPEMVRAVLKGPAMLGYLDAPANRGGRPNENLGRELLELHTMGVGGGYSQRDVQEMARALTGWTIERRFLHARGQFRFDESAHDPGPKSFLGERVPGEGVGEAEWIAQRAALHPATARHLAGRLARFFLGTDAPEVEAEMAKAFLDGRGNVAQTLRPLLLSPEMKSAGPVLRRPFDLIVAAVKATGAETDAGPGLLNHLRSMGQPLYEWPMPDGYPLSERAWGAGFVPRWTFAHAFGHGHIEGTRLPNGADPDATALFLAAPEFQWT